MVNSNIKDSLMGNIMAGESPFYWSDVGGDYIYQENGSVIKLQNQETYYRAGGLPIEISDTSGWLHFITKNDVEIDVRVWTNKNGYFNDIDDNPSYNLSVESQNASVQHFGGDADSYIEFTMRQNSLLSLDVNGDVGAHHITGSRFDLLAQNAYRLDRPEGDSFTLALTNPDGVSNSGAFEKHTVDTLDYTVLGKQHFWLEITAARRVGEQFEQRTGYDGVSQDMTQSDFDTDLSRPTYFDATDWTLLVTREYPSGMVISEPTGLDDSFTVKALVRNQGSSENYDMGRNEYAVFVDGVFKTDTLTPDLVTITEKFREYVEATREYWLNYTPTEPSEFIDIPSLDELKLGGAVIFGGIAIILILVILAKR